MSTIPALSDAGRRTVLDAWGRLVGDEGCFDVPGVLRVSVRSSDSAQSDGWVSCVRLNDAIAVSLPATSSPDFVSQVSNALRARSGPDAAVTADTFGATREVLGPAALSFRDAPPVHNFRHSVSLVDATAARDELLEQCSPDDAAEVGLQDAAGVMATVQLDGVVAAAAWYEPWQETLAHIAVLVRDGYRRRGLAADVAAAAVTMGCDAGLVAQWRARTTFAASRRTAASLDFLPMGTQLTLLLAN